MGCDIWGLWEKPKVPTFLGVPPLFCKAMQIDALQNVNWGGVISVQAYTKTADWRSTIYILESPIYILGVLFRKGGNPKNWQSADGHLNLQGALNWSF